LSKELLSKAGFNTEKIAEYACPSYLYQGNSFADVMPKLKGTPLFDKKQPVIGLNICGWNMEQPPFSKWPRDNEEYTRFIQVIEYITNNLGVNVALLSHSNGFVLEPSFKLIHGRDFPILQQLYNIIQSNKKNDRLFLLDGVYSPGETKSIISQFDMFISGRLHGAVAALSQCVPTIIINYGHEPKAHKLLGFAKQLEMESCVVDPNNLNNMMDTISEYWQDRDKIRAKLEAKIPEMKLSAMEGYCPPWKATT